MVKRIRSFGVIGQSAGSKRTVTIGPIGRSASRHLAVTIDPKVRAALGLAERKLVVRMPSVTQASRLKLAKKADPFKVRSPLSRDKSVLLRTDSGEAVVRINRLRKNHRTTAVS